MSEQSSAGSIRYYFFFFLIKILRTEEASDDGSDGGDEEHEGDLVHGGAVDVPQVQQGGTPAGLQQSLSREKMGGGEVKKKVN